MGPDVAKECYDSCIINTIAKKNYSNSVVVCGDGRRQVKPFKVPAHPHPTRSTNRVGCFLTKDF